MSKLTDKELIELADEHLRLVRYCQMNLASVPIKSAAATMDMLTQLATEMLPEWIELALEILTEKNELEDEDSYALEVDQLEEELQDADRELEKAEAKILLLEKQVRELGGQPAETPD